MAKIILLRHKVLCSVVPACFKHDNASQCKSGKFEPCSLKNPWTDRLQYLNYNISIFMINVYIAFVYWHISYAADLDLNTYE